MNPGEKAQSEWLRLGGEHKFARMQMNTMPRSIGHLLCFFHQRNLGVLSDLSKSVLLDERSIFKHSLEKILQVQRKNNEKLVDLAV